MIIEWPIEKTNRRGAEDAEEEELFNRQGAKDAKGVLNRRGAENAEYAGKTIGC